jgi:hypothetical protein
LVDIVEETGTVVGSQVDVAVEATRHVQALESRDDKLLHIVANAGRELVVTPAVYVAQKGWATSEDLIIALKQLS